MTESPPASPDDPAPEPPRPRLAEPVWLRFSLRRILLAVVVLGAVFGWFAWRRHALQRQLAVVRQLEPFGGTAPDGSRDIRQITFDGDAFDAKCLPLLRRLPHLRRLAFFNVPITDEDLRQVAALPLEELKLFEAPQITDQALEFLQPMPRLQTLWLEQAAITDAGAERLAEFPQLASLNLGGTRITDAALPSLAKRNSLRLLLLHDTQISEAAREQLRLDLPQARIEP